MTREQAQVGPFDGEDEAKDALATFIRAVAAPVAG